MARSWKSEFGERFEVPGVIDFLVRKGFLLDLSSRETTYMPSFGVQGYPTRRKDWDPRKAHPDPVLDVSFWVDHPLSGERKAKGSRFTVVSGEPASSPEESWDFHEVQAAIIKLFEVVLDFAYEVDRFERFVLEPEAWNEILEGPQHDPEDLANSIIDDYYDQA